MERFGNSALQFSAFSIQPFLSRRSQTKTEAFVFAAGWENVAEIIGKFAGTYQLRDAANQLRSLLYPA
ncbi:MAG: hypothetical protein ABSF60_14080 [Verrucomicrobiota bacterium]